MRFLCYDCKFTKISIIHQNRMQSAGVLRPKAKQEPTDSLLFLYVGAVFVIVISVFFDRLTQVGVIVTRLWGNFAV